MNIEKILIIDDDNLINQFLNKKLSKLGYKFESCLDPRLAFETIKNFNPDLIFLDVMMPVINGIELAHMLKIDKNTLHIPIIIISAKSSRQDIKASYNIGVHKYLFKPITFSQILDEIEELKRYVI